MSQYRIIEKILKSQSTMEGSGVRLKRVFGFSELPLLDPFLLLDDFSSNNPVDYVNGFPWHPHRGIETVTYLIDGLVEHEDSLGNKGKIGAGDIQWMTAGSGIIHQEMPKQSVKSMIGFQLWVNLPSSHKMMTPRYQDIRSEQIPEINYNQGVRVKIICGEMEGQKGPVKDIVVQPRYLDVIMEAASEFDFHVPTEQRLFCYVIDGQGYFSIDDHRMIEKEQLVILSDGDRIKIKTTDQKLRFLFISGLPIQEPIAWHGPIVMNNRQELELAFREYQNGTFIKGK